MLRATREKSHRANEQADRRQIDAIEERKENLGICLPRTGPFSSAKTTGLAYVECCCQDLFKDFEPETETWLNELECRSQRSLILPVTKCGSAVAEW